MRFFTLHAFTQIIGTLSSDWTDSPHWTFGVDGALHISSGSVLTALNTDGSVKWTFDAPCEANATCDLLLHKEGLNGAVHIVAQQGLEFTTEPTINDGIKTHYALDGMDGSILWQSTSILTRWCYPWNFLSTGSSIFFVCENEVETIDVADGALKWTNKFDYLTRADVGPDGGLLLSTDSTSLVALQPENGSVKWSLNANDGSRDWRIDSWASSDGGVFVAPHTPCDWAFPGMPAKPRKLDLLRLNGEDGSILWNVSYGLAPEWTPNPFPVKCLTQPPEGAILGSNGEVYVPFLTDEDGVCNLRAFDSNGNTLRTLPCFDFQKSTRHNEDGIEEDLFIASYQHVWNDPTTVLVYSGTTGQSLWNASIANFSIDGTIDVGPDGTIGMHGGYFDVGPDGTIFGSDDDTQTLVAIRNGNEAWRVQGLWFGLMAEDGTTYLGGLGIVVAVDLNGKEKWRWSWPTVGSVLDESSFAVV